jgi:hypothetical protein
MFEGIPKREIPKRLYKSAKQFLEVLSGKTSLKLYLASNYPSLYKPFFREGEILKWKGIEFKAPATSRFSPEIPLILGNEMYSIPECHVKAGDIVFDVGAHFGFFSYYAIRRGAKEVYAFEPNPYVFEILKEHAKLWGYRIKPIQLALSSQSDGEVNLFIATELGSISTMLKI